jgi:hypothetical protein
MHGEHRTTRPRTRGQINISLVLTLAAAAIGAVIFYFFFWADAEIYVDNGGTESITVLVDGAEKLTVGPGQVDSFTCRAGSLHIIAKRGDRVVFDQTKAIEGRRSGRRKYLLNPEATHRYRTIRVQYGMSFPNFQTYSDDEDKARLTAGRLNLVPPTDWIDVEPDHVLEPAPKQVSGKFSDSRKVLTRAPKADADYILTTLANWEKTAKYKLDDEQRRSREAEYSKVEAAADRIEEAPVEVTR